ncbi:MAG: phosphohistidine phosphatase SixA, partial [Cyanobacteria bacterium P01_H01_bin.152]
LASPLVRAQQTAEILLKVELAHTFETTDLLAPGGHLADWLPWLTRWQIDHPTSRLALIGHEPDLSRWAQQLVHGMWGDRWQLKKAGVIGVEVPAAEAAIGRSELFWLAPPRLLL